MIAVKPFPALRPPRDKAYLVATRSYLTYSETELNDKLNNNPYTFLHVINPREGWNLEHGPQKFGLVRDAFEKAWQAGTFRQDPAPQYYIYRQEKDGNEYVGVIAGVAVADYEAGKIKKHEKTLTRREELFTDYLETTRINAEPVLLTYEDDGELDKLFARYLGHRPEYEFTSTDMVLHQLWLVSDTAHQQVVEQAMARQEALYIADGHHRCASSALLAQRVDERPNPPASDAHRYFMALLIGEEQMKVYDYNRLLRNTTEKGTHQILRELSSHFLIEPRGTTPCKPEKIHEIGMFLEGNWYKLAPKMGTYDPSDPVDHLDAEILNRHVLAPIFDIHDLSSDERIDFMAGTEGLEGLEENVRAGKHSVAFALYPVPIEQIKKVSDAGLTMPPKSTFVEPKLRSGLTVYQILPA